MKKIREIVAAYASLRLPDAVKIVEVSPSDGLTNEKKFISHETKIELINRLSDCGMSAIEAVSFKYLQKNNQIAESSAVLKGISKKPGIIYTAFVENYQECVAAVKAGAQEIVIPAAASEGFSQKYYNEDIDGHIFDLRSITHFAYTNNLRVRGQLSCVIGCPYDGDTDPLLARTTALKLKEIGCYEVSLVDNIGIATPAKTKRLLDSVFFDLNPSEVAVHFHNTFGRALESIMAAILLGVTTVETSLGSIGVCSYAEGRTGNSSTEDFVYLMQQLGVETGVDLKKACETANWLCKGKEIPNKSVYQEHDA